MSTTDNQPMDENFYIEKEKREFQEAKDRKEMRDGKENLGVTNESLVGENHSELDQDDLKHQEHHGNRKYKMFTNHDSSHDQPTTNAGPGTV